MDIILITIWIIALLLWFIGNFLPILPGPILSYLALLMIQVVNKSFSTQFLIIMAIICVLITTLDYVAPIIWTKKLWWTKRWTRWSTIWLLIWIVILPILWIVIWPFWLIWLFGWPFLWAYIWERLYQLYSKQNKSNKTKRSNKTALQAALGSLLWFASGILLKIIYTITIWLYFFKETYIIIKDMF